MKAKIICLLYLLVTSCQSTAPQRSPELSDPIDTTWVDGPSDRRTYYAHPLQPIDRVLWELAQMGTISWEDGWEAHCYATRGRGPHNYNLRLDPAWTYRELIARARFAKPIYSQYSGMKVEAEIIKLDTSQQRQISMLKFRVKNLLHDTLDGLSGHVRLYDSSDILHGVYRHIMLLNPIFPNAWSSTFVCGVSKSPERLHDESETDFILRRRRLIQDWVDLLQNPARQKWVFVPEEIRFLNGSGMEDYGYEKTRRF